MTDVGVQLGAAVHQNPGLSREGLLERAFSRMFRGLVYAQIWEDPVADMAALDLSETDEMVTIASGSCNVLSYLTANPRSVTAVDLSPAHVALGRLKLAGARHLPDFDSFYRFFGAGNHAANIELYDRVLAPTLDSETRDFWETRTPVRRRIEIFARGYHRYGALGRFIGTAHVISRAFGVDYRTYLRSQTLSDQQDFFDANISPVFESRLVRALANQRVSLFGLGIPPAQYDKLRGNGDIVDVLRERTRKLMCDFPVSENYFAWAAFNRGYKDDEPRPVPPYLERGQFEAVRAGAERVTLVNRSLTDLLSGQGPATKDAFILLDAQDWMSDDQLTALWTQITRTARPGARVLFRTGGVPDILPGRVPGDILGQWCYDREASETATRNDRSAIYGAVHLYRKTT